MRDTVKYERRGTYTHMSPADTAIWNAFIDKFPDAFITCQYDFMVGDPPPFNTLMDDNTDKNQDYLYRLRIDVVAFTNDSINIIELKPNAAPGTIGQLQSYKKLYERDEEPRFPVNMIIITDNARPNMEYLCKEHNVKLIVV